MKLKPWSILVGALALPLVVCLAVLAFAWPAGRIGPRDLPLGIVGAGPMAERTALALQQAEPGAFDLTLYANAAAARHAIENRDVYGALEISPPALTALTASAASPAVAQLITEVADRIAQQSAAHGTRLAVTTDDVVPAPPQDPKGLVIGTAVLPLTMCAMLFAAAITLLFGVRRAGDKLAALAVISALGGLAVYLIAEGFLGALPDQHVETWGTFALMLFAMSSTITGFVAMLGHRGLGLGAVLLVFVGNPFSGASSAPELLPKAVGDIGQLLPPGAGVSLLRSTAYFQGHGPTVHLVVLVCWSVFGILTVIAGHHSFVGYAARHDRGVAAATEVEPALELESVS
jgi:hypothetical protein